VYLFDKDSSTPLWNYTTGGNVRSIAISADGEFIAAGSRDDKVYFFHTDSSALLWSHTTGDDMSSVAISADGAYIAAGSADYKVYALQHRPSIHGTGIAISTVVAAEVGGLQVRDITVRNTTSHGIATLSTASDFILERVHVSQTGSESLLMEGSGHSIIASSFSGQASFQNSASLMTEDTVFDEFSLSSQEGAYLENVSANYLTISGGSNILLRDSSFATLLSLDGNSLDNRALDTTFGSISCEFGSTLAIEYRTVIELRTVQGAGSWLEIEVTEDSTGWYDQVVYYTSFFGGGEPLTDEEGLLPELLIAGLVYNGSSTPGSAVTYVQVQFNGIQKFNFTLTGDSTRVIWLNLPPVPVIESVDPTPVIQSDIRSPLDSETLAWWPLDEGTGTSVIDASGSGNNLTLEPTQSWALGLSGSAVLFDGQFIYLAGPVIKPTEMTIELWFNTTDSGIGTLISDYHSADSNWNHHLYLVDGEPRFAQTQDILGYGSPSIRGGIPLTLEAGSQFNDGYWHHIAVVRSSEELSLWVDGEMLDSKLSEGADPSARNTWIGMAPDGSNAYA
ncbi:MAG TPA: hypothetical protein HA339_02825, partial [Candidatus Poseidoniia archaeon]|nr:hypothetical protein [Candidatus Poseidoniia archaeon]